MSFLKCLSPGIFRGCYVVCNYIYQQNLTGRRTQPLFFICALLLFVHIGGTPEAKNGQNMYQKNPKDVFNIPFLFGGKFFLAVFKGR